MLNTLHTQLIDTRDLVEGLRALASNAGDDGIIQITGSVMDRLLRTVHDGIDGCIDTLENECDKRAQAHKKAQEADDLHLSVS